LSQNLNNIIPTLLSRVQTYKFNKSHELEIELAKDSDKRSQIFSKLVNSKENYEKLYNDKKAADLFNVASDFVENIKIEGYHQAASLLINMKESLTDKELFFNVLLLLINEDGVPLKARTKINSLLLKYKKDSYLKINEILFYDSFAIEVRKIQN